jgi:uncharacterized membrane protein (DUF106 family)
MMYDWLLNNALFVLLVLCAAVIIIGLIVTALTKVRRAEFARLQDEVKDLSELVKALEVAEQRRFLKELNSHSERAEPSLVSAISESRSPDLQLLRPEKEVETAPPLVP